MAKAIASDTRQANAASAAVSLTFKEKMAAGAIARGVAQTVLHPVDVIRTRLQARNVSASWKPGVFVKGVIPQISLAIPAGAIQFLAFEAAKEKLEKWMPDDKLSQTRILIAGGMGALAAASCRIPQEVLKQTIQADIYPNIAAALKGTLFSQGVGSLYRGSVATISRDVPWNGLSFMFHGQGKRMFQNMKGRAPETDENLVLAGIAGAIAAVIMTPIDVVKTRIMTQQIGATKYSGLIGTLNKIIAEEGAGTLMKGVLPRIIFLAPLAGITFSVYEAVAANMRNRRIAQAHASAHKHDLTFTDSQDAAKELRQKAFALRFAKTPVRLASASTQTQLLSDYRSSSPVFFSLPS